MQITDFLKPQTLCSIFCIVLNCYPRGSVGAAGAAPEKFSTDTPVLGAPTHSHHKAPEKHSMGGKNLAVLLFEWQGLVECCCHSSESLKAAVASRYFLICLVKLSVGFVFGSASVQTAGRTPSLGLLP